MPGQCCAMPAHARSSRDKDTACRPQQAFKLYLEHLQSSVDHECARAGYLRSRKFFSLDVITKDLYPAFSCHAGAASFEILPCNDFQGKIQLLCQETRSFTSAPVERWM